MNPSGSNGAVNLRSLRARKARLGTRLGKPTQYVLQAGTFLSFLLVLAILADAPRQEAAWTVAAVGLICYTLEQWLHHDLLALPPTPPQAKQGNGLEGRLSSEVLGRLPTDGPLTPLTVWLALTGHWHMNFIMNRMLLTSASLAPGLGQNEADMEPVWRTAEQLANQGRNPAIEPGHIITAILLHAEFLAPVFKQLKYSQDDIAALMHWLERILSLQRSEQPFFGGIGRDWASGFTPTLNRYAQNISISIEQSGAHFGSLTGSPGVKAIQDSFAQGSGGVALIGQEGIGKTSHVHALAELLLQGKVVPTLKYHQVMGLNPSVLISSAQHPGELEQIVLTLLSEAVHAGHIILFLDDAQLFFTNGPGSLDLTQILQPVMQSGKVRLIMAMDPSDWQRLRAHNPGFANQLTPVMLAERPQADVMDALEDSVLGFEHGRNLIVSYDALREAYRLSGRYEQESAYPGKALQLLERSLTHAEHGNLVTATSVQRAIEQTKGVKVAAATQLEADSLLNLEDTIHQRMINQSRAVKVVAAALRRARAGVSSPKRPIGSFLFLGPTGVGKTELAKAIASSYFNDETNMVRLDMSEYQRPEDVSRLLSDGKEESNSLILAVRRQPFTVVLLDEIEKAHPNILNLLLQMLDEGSLTDTAGRQVSFRDCIVICTSNAGADSIRQRIEAGQELESFEKEFTDQLIGSGQFKPELLNRFDEIVLFRPLKPEELAQVVKLMVGGINKTLAPQNITVQLTDTAVSKIVETGNDPRLGARPMRRMLQRAVEDGIANRILRGQAQPGDHIVLDVTDLAL